VVVRTLPAAATTNKQLGCCRGRVEPQTGWRIRKFVYDTRKYRIVKIEADNQTRSAADLLSRALIKIRATTTRSAMQFDGYRVSGPPTDGADIPAATDTPLFPDRTRATLRSSAASPGMRQLTAESAHIAAALSLKAKVYKVFSDNVARTWARRNA
jgi:hypothetical protein